MKKRTLIYVITILVIILLAIIMQVITNKKETKENKELTKVKVSEVTRSVFYAPQYVAINNGYFKKYGIDIDLTTGGGADTVMTAVLSNQVEIGFAGPEASIYVYNEGKEDYCQVFAQMTKKDGSFLVAKTKTENFNWQDLKGKTVIPGRKGGVPYMTLEYVLKKNGINPQTDLNLDDSIKFDLMAGAFTSGTAEYVTLFEPTASLTEQQGKGYIVASVGKEAGDRTDVSREFAPFIAQGIDGKPRILSTPNGFASGGEKGTAADMRSECFMLIACLLNLRFG